MKYISLLCCICFVGCGQTGPLYLPGKVTKENEHRQRNRDQFIFDSKKEKNKKKIEELRRSNVQKIAGSEPTTE